MDLADWTWKWWIGLGSGGMDVEAWNGMGNADVDAVEWDAAMDAWEWDADQAYRHEVERDVDQVILGHVVHGLFVT